MGQGAVAVLLPLLLITLFLIIEIIRHRRTQPAQAEAVNVSKTPDMLRYGVRNWRTVQDMIKWQGEVSRIDGLLSDLQPAPR